MFNNRNFSLGTQRVWIKGSQNAPAGIFSPIIRLNLVFLFSIFSLTLPSSRPAEPKPVNSPASLPKSSPATTPGKYTRSDFTYVTLASDEEKVRLYRCHSGKWLCTPNDVTLVNSDYIIWTPIFWSHHGKVLMNSNSTYVTLWSSLFMDSFDVPLASWTQPLMSQLCGCTVVMIPSQLWGCAPVQQWWY